RTSGNLSSPQTKMDRSQSINLSQDTGVKQNGHTGVHRPVAGVFLEKTKETITIFQAMKKRLLRPGTALALLEAQAATVGIIDPVNNRILPVADAVKEGIVGPEMKEKLLTAEKAISGYVDPYTNQIISVFQAIQKDLVPRDYGLRLLEAQIATHGLFDPVEKTSISVESAIQKEMNRILEDSGDDTKGFFDPNTEENLTYLQLMERCVVDPITGLCLLPLLDKSNRGSEKGKKVSAGSDRRRKCTNVPTGERQHCRYSTKRVADARYCTGSTGGPGSNRIHY
uniref:Uncharacterized protein n=1 Tax=Mola mola TaxID=94237 RepID=A0A3Q3X9Q4_MOLML